jgi:hypothetical protein
VDARCLGKYFAGGTDWVVSPIFGLVVIRECCVMRRRHMVRYFPIKRSRIPGQLPRRPARYSTQYHFNSPLPRQLTTSYPSVCVRTSARCRAVSYRGSQTFDLQRKALQHLGHAGFLQYHAHRRGAAQVSVVRVGVAVRQVVEGSG